MKFPAGQPEKNPESQENAFQAAERRRRQDLLDASIVEVPATLSWGERLLPLLFAAMETCWIYALLLGLVSINLFQTNESLVPVWAPFVLILGTYWLSLHIERREASASSHTANDAADAISQTPTALQEGRKGKGTKSS